jgi:hypothetical protein
VILEETRTTNTADKKLTKHKLKRKIKKSADEVNYKILKVYNILDDLLNKYKKDKEIGKILKNPFKVRKLNIIRVLIQVLNYFRR